MKNKRDLFSVILLLGVLFLIIIYFGRNNTSKSTVESKAVSVDTQAEAQHRIDSFSNSNLKPSTNIISAPEEAATNNQPLDGKIKSLIAEEETLNRECRGGSSDSPETMKYCDKRDALFAKLNKLDWCFGRDDQAEYEKEWMKCHINQNDKNEQNTSHSDDRSSEIALVNKLIMKFTSESIQYDDIKNADHPTQEVIMEGVKHNMEKTNVLASLAQMNWCFREGYHQDDFGWSRCSPKGTKEVKFDIPINDEINKSDEHKLATCLAPKAENSKYPSGAGVKSALLLLSDCDNARAEYLISCISKGVEKNYCALTAGTLALVALKTFNK